MHGVLEEINSRRCTAFNPIPDVKIYYPTSTLLRTFGTFPKNDASAGCIQNDRVDKLYKITLKVLDYPHLARTKGSTESTSLSVPSVD